MRHNPFDLERKIKKVIESCENVDQLLNYEKVSKWFFKEIHEKTGSNLRRVFDQKYQDLTQNK